jgi:ApaG protein
MSIIGQTESSQRGDGLFAWHVMSHDVDVAVVPEYLPERSNPERNFYSYAYYVTVTNLGPEPIQLVRRHWTITDGTGYVETIEGEGVVGEKPWISPGASYDYESGCPLRTPTGNMRGWYHFNTKSGTHFKSRIPLFFLRTNSLRH